MKLANKVAIITGAAGGMGQAAAILFAQEGAKIAVIDLKESAAQPTVDQIRANGGTAIAIGADITRTEDVKRIVSRTVDELGPPNILYNNAGIDTEGKKPLIHVTEDEFDRTVAVNLKGPWLMMKYVVPHMIEAGGGSIVNTASIAAFFVCNTVGYCGAKAGVVMMTKVAAVELGRYNIRVNALCPGATKTPMGEKVKAEMDARKAKLPVVDKMGVLGRMATPLEMAKMALFLASDDSSFATGSAFINDGGWTSMSGLETVAP
ncbi:SDR family NAD(P)-dependent oxidoreductase [Steroidobacter flavus]|uniref:SDR family NAD(P)-dependent oxidoreductase n=1 Tax=Steroidobacter flavus TaxID=1842136 RepID=A0ABV8T5P6_9GAMM